MGKGKIFFIVLIFISGLLVTTAGAVPVIIGFKDKAHPEIVKPLGEVTYSYKYTPAVAADLPEQAIENLEKNPNIVYIELDYEVKALEQTVPWGITQIGADVVYDTGNSGEGINVAIIDTGIDYTHPDLKDNYVSGMDFVNGDSDPLDDNGHGTHCAGIIAAADNDIGVIGVAPAANLYALKVLDSNGSGDVSDVIAAIEWAITTRGDDDDTNNIQIISMSLGSNKGVLALQSVCSRAYEDGILLVAAAGNDGRVSGIGDTVDYPGAYSSVIAVAATDKTNTRTYFSSTGPDVELAAPGLGIYSTYLGDYEYLSGTSMACPHVAGTAALVLKANPTYTNKEVRARLAQTATDLGTSGRDNWYGFGLVNAEAAADFSAADEDSNKVHISGVDVTTSPRIEGRYTYVSATAIVTIEDNQNTPVGNAIVTGSWSGATTNEASGTTDVDGKVTLESNEVKYKKGTLIFTFTVNGVSHEIPWDGIITSGTETYPET